jgi:hypothetical protein
VTKSPRKRRRRKGLAVLPEQGFPTRLHPHQLHLVAKAKALRSEANALRSQVSAGSYGDPERERFYKLAQNAGLILRISNPELAERAGLGSTFFSTLIRDRRYPKLANFLRALTAIIDVADERLSDIDREAATSGVLPGSAKISQRILQDRQQLLTLAQSLSQLAWEEIDKLDAERPNDPDRIGSYEKQRELLQLFANGFSRIAKELAAIKVDEAEPALLNTATKAIESVGNGLNRWWRKNREEAIDWAIRMPVITAGVAALGWAGANMTVGTTIVAALVGGKKVTKAIRKRWPKAAKK